MEGAIRERRRVARRADIIVNVITCSVSAYETQLRPQSCPSCDQLHILPSTFPLWTLCSPDEMTASPTQLFLLADHIKLSLLERQRAISLNLEPNSQDGHISRSLESMREGIEAVEEERIKLEQSGDP
jgi:hypothetical protein